MFEWSTFLGTSDLDFITCLDADEDGNIYAAGGTCSYDFPVPNGQYTLFNAGDNQSPHPLLKIKR